ncbi:MAG: UDP-N-acetylmuramoyl-tripeptide--D-alanyl-D-alanine ligase [Gemmatimonadota bacterium]
MTHGFTWTDARVRDALGIGEAGADPRLAFTGVSTDTRSVSTGQLFVALTGERFDGHDFVGEAVARGARGAIVSRSVEPDSALTLYRVDDTLTALGALARYRRRALPARVVGVTGSAGKTTVKNFLAAALAPSYRVHATRGNLNNRVGVPLTLLGTPETTEILVLEMGTSEPGEIAILTTVSEPDASVVTTVSEAHLEGLGSFQGVLREKLDLTRGTRTGGPIVVGDVPEELPREARAMRPDVQVAGFTSLADAELRAELHAEPDEEGRFRFRLWDREITAPVPGRHGARNFLLALVMARSLGARLDAAVRGASEVRAGSLRGEVRRVGGLTLLLDCYNANPQSVAAALDLLAELPGARGRIAFLGTMLELGEETGRLHRAVLERALALPLDLIVASGAFADPARVLSRGRGSEHPALLAAETIEEGYAALLPRLTGSETVLLKASRGVAMEGLLDRFEADFGGEG